MVIMQRYLTKSLISWKNQSQPLPLLVRGARQVGKSYLIEDFGKKQFDQLVTINFEYQPELKECFNKLDPTYIIEQIKLRTGETVQPGNTLLFLDEIQEYPQAIMALRYFKEQLPAQHVIGAGSLLEFTLNDENFSLPVGRVQFLHLKPLSFKEFLMATGKTAILNHLNTITLNQPLADDLHTELLKSAREYMVVGGMPAVIKSYLENRDFNACQQMQSALLNGYRNDFSKYAKTSQHKYLQRIFEKTPGLVGEHFKYSKIDPQMRSRDLKLALRLLQDAGLIYPAYLNNASGLPLYVGAKEKTFKLFFLDIGLVKRSTHLDAKLLLQEDLLLLNQGMIAEQFVAQELIAYYPPYDPPPLYYWSRDKRGSSAEVDFITHVGDKIIPIEVKSGSAGRMKSIRLLMKEKQLLLGVQISMAPLSLKNGILSIPLYMIGELERLVRDEESK